MAAILCLLGSILAIGLRTYAQVLSSTQAAAPPASSSQSLSTPGDANNPPHELVTQSSLAPPAIMIPRLSRSPPLADCLTMDPLGALAPQMARLSRFVR